MKMTKFSFNYHGFRHFQTPTRWAWFVSCVLALLLWSYRNTSLSSISNTPKLQQKAPPSKHDSRNQLPSMVAPSHNQVPLVEDSHWGQLHCQEKDFLLYAYSAFYDDRDQKNSLYIRVVASSESPEGVGLSCLMFYSGQVQPEVATPLYMRYSFNEKYNGKVFKQGIYSCPLTTGTIPKSVSIVCNSSLPKKAAFRLRVQVPEKPKQKRDFAICVCAVYGSRNAYQLVEWMELQSIFGVSKVTAYNHSMTDETARIFLHYAEEGFVDFRQTVPFRTETTGSAYHNMKMHQGTTLNDCILRNMHSFKRILIIDYDELIVPQQHRNLSEMMALITAKYNPRNARQNYSFRNQVFPFEFAPDQNVSSKLVTMAYRTSLQLEHRKRMKSIIDPTICTHMGQHYCFKVIQSVPKGRHSFLVDPNYGRNQHYKIFCDPRKKGRNCPTTVMNMEQFQDNTMLRFQEELTPRVAKQLEKLGMEPL